MLLNERQKSYYTIISTTQNIGEEFKVHGLARTWPFQFDPQISPHLTSDDLYCIVIGQISMLSIPHQSQLHFL
jgi:hypothetical protein